MLQFEMLPASFAMLLATLRPCFTAPTFRTFAVLLAGMIAQPGRNTVTGMLTGAGLAGTWHHSRAHAFFGQARWSVAYLSDAVCRLVVATMLPVDDPVLIVVDDTLFRRSGRKVHATGWHHDGAAKGPRGNKIGWGNNWVIAAIIVHLPFCRRPVALPVGFALWTPGDVTKQVLACRLVTAITATTGTRQVHLVADSHYAGADGAAGATKNANRERGLPTGVTLTSRLRANAQLKEIAAPIPGRGGRPKRIGPTLGTPKNLAATTTWTPAQVTRYSKTDTVNLSDTHCLWYGAYRSREIRVILLRDHGTTTGYDLALITTDLTTPATDLITRYAARWSIEVAIGDAKQTTGVGQAHNRTPTAVNRTVPFGLLAQTLTICWYTHHGHHPETITERRTNNPWYRTKTEPAYHDMIIKLRRTLITARIREGSQLKPTPEQTHTILLAWAQAAA